MYIKCISHWCFLHYDKLSANGHIAKDSICLLDASKE